MVKNIMRTDLAVLFDLDSTLVDSSAAVRNSWIQLAGEAGFAPQALVGLHGVPAEGCIRILLPHADETEVQHWTARIEDIEVGAIDGVVAIPGAIELLAALDEREIPWTIVTSCTAPLAKIRTKIAGIAQPTTTVTFSDVTHGKPHAEPFLLGASRLGVDPSNCWVIEDAHSGVTAGKSAGATVAAVLTTHSREELPHADHYLESLLDLLTLIDQER
ncbi:unannotated protein [freshwater metagenome]|uniref:Unannotated protein n=1 Tax=freshwater metagenome TaxID=449393 RepID=A0A6J5YRN8_9ZZZZ